ncbi:hypothetical protein BDN71DRAFT_1096407 [Pleurotus eryngii]|uniref:Uncharacterized protein n=1 Tax=Pleurotus eryngii TaxID=5323 RepID=A0A9P5ZVJ7_PLEER|nr:hypothetical protein BDN71DRAFT_1096407 [Pleurotus eryngii]
MRDRAVTRTCGHPQKISSRVPPKVDVDVITSALQYSSALFVAFFALVVAINDTAIVLCARRRRFVAPRGRESRARLDGHASMVFGICFSPLGSEVFCCADGDSNGSAVRRLHCHRGHIPRLPTPCGDSKLRAWMHGYVMVCSWRSRRPFAVSGAAHELSMLTAVSGGAGCVDLGSVMDWGIKCGRWTDSSGCIAQIGAMNAKAAR